MTGTSFTLLGLGAMGRALAAAALDAGHSPTLWNRTPGRAGELLARGAREAASAREAITSADLIIVCLYDHASVHETLDPESDALRGRTLINLTTTTPEEARELSAWAAQRDIAYLDGAVMSVPGAIGSAEALILYSGSPEVFTTHREFLNTWAGSTHEGEDPGLASLWDLALLSGMYSMFAGFLQGVAMLQSAGVGAAEYAERAAPFLASMTELLGHSTEHLDKRDYGEPLQSLEWTTTLLDTITRAASEQGITPAPVDMVQRLIRRQIDAGHGAEDFDRIIESMR
ncbi:NAD(P)-binding domain-containing protein [Streptomyces calidiresistens]|uniref:NAD(P)-dependent oxidoreductase n=1 Tax=Streptomyces calidiresistens TaxID=1485586 RepID=A0A7W3XUL8_9ACTN|nr:NAD(P)-binding domain-containing protein [Streptomyces calidiresistens]MBB0228035.1 NAD(P)-dependent oxidoreductase [Streptomyces calidiresistens]